MKIYINNLLKFLLLKKKNFYTNYYIYIFNNIFFYCIKIERKMLYYDKSNKYLIIKTNKNEIIKNKYLSNFFYYWNHINTFKINLTGKGFKLKKYTHTINFYVNLSHLIKFISKNSNVLKNNKSKFVLLNINLSNNIKKFLNTKPTNIFTKKGIRLNRTKIKKKRGKTSSK